MLNVKTYLDKSSIHGIGLFANQFIEKGDLIWQFTKGIDQWLDRHELEKQLKDGEIGKAEFDFVQNAAVYDEDYDAYCLVADNVRFMNHSSESNCGETQDTGELFEMFALRDIHPEEEITLDYNEVEEGSDDFSEDEFKNYNSK